VFRILKLEALKGATTLRLPLSCVRVRF